MNAEVGSTAPRREKSNHGRRPLRLRLPYFAPAIPGRRRGFRRDRGLAGQQGNGATCRAQIDRYPPSFLSARLSEAADRLGGPAQSSASRRAERVESRRRSRSDGQERHCDEHAVARLDTRRLVRRRRRAGSRHGAPMLRFRRRDGARPAGPLWPIRAAVDARHRRDAQRDRIRLRYAQSRRHQPADQLRRQVAWPSDL